MKKLTTSVLAVVLSSSFAVVSAQKVQDTAKTQDIEGVVVTALGIKREKKSLGYASQEVKADALFDGTTNTGNIASQLSGKVAGLNVTTNSNFGGTANLVIRGIKALGGTNPLIVIDGSPVNNTSTYSGNYNGGFDLGNGLADINQEDIESVNVLKGAAASALYGERALNGVIVITTKNGKGKDDKSWGVTLSSSIQTGFIDKSTFPEYQTRYGAGYDPSFYFGADSNKYNNVNFGEDASWGPEYDGSLVRYWDSYDPTSPTFGKARPWQAAKNGPIKFFETPFSYVNSISLSKGTKGNNFNLTYDNNTSNGLMPNSKLSKNTLSTKINYDLTDKLHATVYSTLTLQNTIGRTETGYNDNITTGFRQWWQTNTDLYDLRDAYYRNIASPVLANNYGNVTWNRKSATNGVPNFWNNPYFQRYQNYESDNRNRVFSYAQLVYDVDRHISITGKVSYDNTKLLFERRLAVGSYAQNFGLSQNPITSGYDRIDITRREVNYDLFASYKYDLTSWLNISGIVGGNVRSNLYDSVEASTEGGLIKPFLYSLDNSAKPELNPLENYWKTQTQSFYATASFDFAKIFYLDGTFRRDKSSTLPVGDNAYNYGSVSGSLIMSELLKMDNSVVNFWKLRGNYAVVGGTADPYQLQYQYYTAGSFNGGSVGTIGIYKPVVTLPNPYLKPQKSNEYEFGTEVHFLRDRITLDGAYYNSKVTNQIISGLTISAGSGQLAANVNAGQITTKGFEAHLGLVPLKSQNFDWNVDVNWARNRSIVDELGYGLDVYNLVGLVGGATIVAKQGNQWGDIYGSDYVYLNGQKVVDPITGLYETQANQVIGNTQPKWTGGIRNSFRYKDFSLSFLIDVRHGGDIFSSDLYYGLASGLYPETAVDGYRTTQAVLSGVNPNGQPNVTPVSDDYPAAGYGNNANDSYALAPDKRFVYDGSFIKLREASITYSLPKSLLHGTFINDAKISIVGRNLWIIHKNLPYADPESTQMGGLYSYGSSVGSLPTTRDIGVNVTFKF